VRSLGNTTVDRVLSEVDNSTWPRLLKAANWDDAWTQTTNAKMQTQAGYAMPENRPEFTAQAEIARL